MQIMTLEEIHPRLEALAQKVIEDAGMDLIEFKLGGNKNDLFIQITADKPFGGITIHECAILNRSLVAAIEQENLLSPEHFSLELSSPGLDRPLVTRKDFMRMVTQELRFWLKDEVGGKKEVQGVLTAVEGLSLIIDAPGARRLVLPLSNIVKGMLVI